MPITERLAKGMTVLFVGFNPSPASYERGFNYAGRSNRFYKVLHLSGLTTRLYAPEESPHLLEDYGYGFTNLVARPTKTAAEVTRAEYAAGRVILTAKIEEYKPRFVCCVGKGVYEQYARPRKAVPWGFQAADVVAGVRDFVAPSTSGLVRMTLAQQVEIYRELAEAVRGRRS